MIQITVEDLIKNCKAKLLIGNKDAIINECFVNSNDVTKDGCFFGIKGKKTNGSLFYKQAFDNGASVCVLNKIYDLDLNGYDDKTVIIADDPFYVLQSLASYKRSLFNGPVIAITGSVGKTSTKEMVANVLSQKYKVLKTSGNQNSQIGLPLTILRLKDEDVMVLEMGMNHEGEIHNLSLIAKPNISVITNVYDAHIGNLGSRENILKAKLEITDGMDDGTLIINNDNDMLNMLSNNIKPAIKVMSFGIKNQSNVMAYNIKEGITTTFDIGDIKDFKVKIGKIIYNALASYLIGKLLGVSRSMIRNGINKSGNQKHRLEVINLNNNSILIDDAYNASYDSVILALEYMKNFDGKKIVILGDILELGKKSKFIHKKIGSVLNKYLIEELITIGKHSKYISKEAKKGGLKRKYIKHFKNELKARNYVKSRISEDTVLLIKGSNAINLINLVEYLKEGLNS